MLSSTTLLNFLNEWYNFHYGMLKFNYIYVSIIDRLACRQPSHLMVSFLCSMMEHGCIEVEVANTLFT